MRDAFTQARTAGTTVVRRDHNKKMYKRWKISHCFFFEWTVKEFLQHELEAVRELNKKQPDKMYEAVIEYLEKRLSGEIQ